MAWVLIALDFEDAACIVKQESTQAGLDRKMPGMRNQSKQQLVLHCMSLSNMLMSNTRLSAEMHGSMAPSKREVTF